MFGYFCFGFTDLMLKGKSLLDNTNLFSLKEYEKNDKIVLKYFQINSKKVKMIKIYCIDWGRYRKFKNPKVLYILETILGISIICCNDVNGCKKYLKKNN